MEGVWGDHLPQLRLGSVFLSSWVTPAYPYSPSPTLCLASFRAAPWVGRCPGFGVDQSHQGKQISGPGDDEPSNTNLV